MLDWMMLGVSGSVIPSYPDSGPGPKTLQFGNTSLGYFGEVTTAQLFTGREFINGAKAFVGNYDVAADSITNLWFKFFHNNKVIYISKIPLINTVSWEDLYKFGLVYGTMDNGKYPVAGSETWQYNPLIKNEGGRDWVLIPRMIKAMAADPYAALTSANYLGSEWTELLGRMTTGNNTPVSEKWGGFSGVDIKLGYELGMETQGSAPANTLYLAAATPSNFFSRTPMLKTGASSMVYRPVLQLANVADGLIPVDSIVTDSLGLKDLILYDVKIQSDSELNLGIMDIQFPNTINKPVLVTIDIDTASSAYMVTEVVANDETSTWGSFTISGSYTA